MLGENIMEKNKLSDNHFLINEEYNNDFSYSENISYNNLNNIYGSNLLNKGEIYHSTNNLFENNNTFNLIFFPERQTNKTDSKTNILFQVDNVVPHSFM